MLVTQSAQLQSRLSAKGAVRESRKLEPKLPTGANDVKALPRRRDFETAVDPTKAWAQPRRSMRPRTISAASGERKLRRTSTTSTCGASASTSFGRALAPLWTRCSRDREYHLGMGCGQLNYG